MKRGRDPWESRKANWAHLLVRLGQLTSCAGGEARETPKRLASKAGAKLKITYRVEQGVNHATRIEVSEQ
jgi:hypothetical protein